MNFNLALTVLAKHEVQFDHLNNHGHHLTETKAGRIDALGSVGINGDVHYEHVAEDAVELDVSDV